MRPGLASIRLDTAGAWYYVGPGGGVDGALPLGSTVKDKQRDNVTTARGRGLTRLQGRITCARGHTNATNGPPMVGSRTCSRRQYRIADS